MGVNLPAHLVVIKSTQYYGNGGYQDYSDSQILQMIGRAGRPQFDTSAVAVIMTKASCKVRYSLHFWGTGMRCLSVTTAGLQAARCGDRSF